MVELSPSILNSQKENRNWFSFSLQGPWQVFFFLIELDLKKQKQKTEKKKKKRKKSYILLGKIYIF